MESPSPLPSIFLELSPRTKRSNSSSPSMFSAYLEIFRKIILHASPSLSMLTYALVEGCAYLQILFIRFSNILHKCLESAETTNGSFALFTISSISFAFSFSSNSPIVCVSITCASQRSHTTDRVPADALEASIKSSISFFRRPDWRLSTFRYSCAAWPSISSFSSKST